MEAGSSVAHPPQLFISVLRSAALSGCFHQSLPSCVDSVIGENQDRQRDEPHAYEPQLDRICGDGQIDWGLGRSRLTAKHVSWRILGPVDVGCDDTACVSDADVEGQGGSSLVLTGDIPAEPTRISSAYWRPSTDETLTMQ